ncbi:amino acid adenylation domain-containing protein [Allonocardiopsis opalescens]|uniref:Amino acid adenylation domain-containing protein n=1 Tax=Allonocardiopsis opalescens TaxID=1144618 RepID=A0A2T0PY96_9ACTN|nr:non-ribosomal peptide synthetase [Allonocardiopsis opalescens]PRX96525.1 amino acid adenylation domain-containing protein [Allonocardiopsis opalescens]
MANPEEMIPMTVNGWGGGASSRPAAADRPERIPLSFAQQRLWFLAQLEGPSATYNIPVVLRLSGSVDSDALEQAFQDVAERHEPLRTVFEAPEGEPYQRILGIEECGRWLEVRPCTPESLPERVREASGRPFDLDRRPPFRAWLFTLAPDQGVLVLVLHHIAGDGWSMGPLTRDLMTAYQARAEGRAPGWEPLPVQYADYALWQRESMDGGGIAEQLDYWTDALADMPTHLGLPTDRPRPAVVSGAGDAVHFSIPEATHRRLAEFCRERDITPFMALHAVFTALLHRLGAGDDIVLGTPIAGRTDEELWDLVGFFVNTLVLRTDLSGDPSFDELLTLVMETDLLAYAHADVPFEHLVEALRPVRSVDRHPLFQVMLAFHTEAAVPEFSLGGVEVRPEPVDLPVAKFDLSLLLQEHRSAAGEPAGIAASLEFATDLFEREGVERMARRLLGVLDQMVGDPALPLSRVQVLLPDEKELPARHKPAPQPGYPAPGGRPERRAPAGAVEAALCELFGEVLGRTDVGPDDDFFELGGHSLLVIRLISRVRSVLAAELDVVQVFQRPTPAAMAELINAAKAPTGGASSRLTAADRPERIPLSFAQQRLWFLAQLEGPSATYNIPVVLRLSGSVDAAALEQAFQDVAERHEPLRTVFEAPEGEPYQRILGVAECGRWLEVRPCAPELLAERVREAAAWHFDLGARPPFRAWLFPVAPQECVLVLVLHHIAGDGWSMGPLTRDLMAAYQARTRGEAPGWEPLLVQYADYALWQHERLGDGGIADQLDYWTDALADMPTHLGLPTDHPRPAVVGGGGDTVHFSIPEATHRRLAEFCRERDVTPFMAMHALFAVVLHRLGAGDDIVLGTPIAGRTDEELWSLVGFFVNTLVLRTDLSGDPSFEDVVARVMETDLLAYAHADVPFEHLVEALRPVRSVDRHPLFQVMLAFHTEAAVPEFSLGGIEVRPEPVDLPVAKFDLSLLLQEYRSEKGEPAGIAASLEFATDLFERESVERMAQRLLGVLDQALGDPAVPLSRVQVLLPDETELPARHTAAPEPGYLAGAGRPERRAPAGAVEAALCELFGEVLGRTDVRPDDDFFALGGHSLLVVRLISRVRAVLGAELDVVEVFQRPTVAAMAELVGAARTRTGGRPPLAPRERPEEVPLSFAQRRLWFLKQIEGPSATYNIPVAVRLHGRVDAAALRAGLADVAARHESLRTVFPVRDGRPFQRVLPADEARPALEVRHCAEDELPGLVDAAAAVDFDLAADLPLRAALLTLRPDEHVLVLVVHHIAGDGWSMGPLIQDLSLACAARLRGQAPDWEPLAVQYADYTLWQHEWLGDGSGPSPVLERQTDFWTRALAGLPEQIALPVDRPRPAVAGHSGDTVDFTVPAELHTGLVKLARAHGATSFMTLQAAFAVLLAKMGAGTDIAIGSPTAGRGDEALEPLVGFFVNTLVLRTDLSGDPDFTEVLARVVRADLAAFDHQDVPFEYLVERLNPARSTARHPLFQVMFQLNPAAVAPGSVEIAGTRVTQEPFRTRTAKFDLNLAVREDWDADGGPAGLAGSLEYATELFDRRTAAALTARLVRVLEQVAADAAVRLSGIDVALPGDPGTADWRATARAVPERTAVQLFEEQAARTPDAAALTFAGQTLSYAELDRQANRLARLLAERGAGPEDFVALLLPRSVELVTALLAVLKTGAAYLPLDPAGPGRRTAALLDDARPRVLVALEGTAEPLPEAAAAGALLLDAPDVRSALAARSARPLAGAERTAAPDPGQAMYLIYTSGSTGRPKGVVNAHRGVVNRLSWMVDAFGLGPGDALLNKTPYTFDVSVWELFTPLVCGARLVLAEPDAHRDPARLSEVIRAEQVTVTQFVPSMLRAFLSAEDLGACTSLRAVVCSGEALTPDLVRAAQRGGAAPLHNLYGPTEAAIEVSHWPCAVDDPGPVVPIGRPIDNTGLYVVDPSGGLAPAGVAGELMISGLPVARGYLGRPGRTAELFVPDPFGPAGSRAYRTGDVARRRWDGAIEYHGRLDHQVKIRGFRIELGEVEAALEEHPGIAAAVVVVAGDQERRRLAGYVVPAGPGELDTSAVRRFLSERLPEYMVPAALAVLPELPLTSSGKVDRARLPAVATAESGRRRARTERERLLCELFADVLDLPDVGADDDFFALGGHSLLAVRLVGLARSVLGAELPAAAVFRAPTPAALAAEIEAAERAGAPRPALARRERPQRPPLSHAQQRLWFLARLEGPSATYNIPLALRLDGPVDAAALRAALADLAARHETLRTVFPAPGGRPYQQVLEPGLAEPPLTEADCTEDGLADAIAAAADTRFAIESEPPLRAWLLTLDPRRHVLVLVLHHIAGDVLSMEPLLRDLGAAYRARCAGTRPDWEPLPVQYADYTLWQRELLTGGEEGDDPDAGGGADGRENGAGGVLRGQVEYWTEQLADLPEPLPLPTDRPRPAAVSYRGDHVAFGISADLHTRLRALVRSSRATSFMAVQAAFAALLSRLGAGTDIPIGAPSAGRGHELLDGLVGFFANTLVLRTDLSGDPTFTELLDRVRETDLAAYSNADLPFEHLVEAVKPVRTTAWNPLFQVMLAFNAGVGAAEQHLGGARVGLEPVRATTAKFDLTLNVHEAFAHDGRPEGISGVLEYATDLFERRTAERMTARLVRVLEQVSADPGIRLSRIDVLLAGERTAAGRPARAAQRPAAARGTATAPAPVPPRERRPPRTPDETLLCSVFAEVLERPQVGVDDGFFELGGHSLLVVRLVERVREVMGVELAVADVFRSPTPAGLLGERGAGGDPLDPLLPLRTAGEAPPLFCVHPALGLSWCYAGLVSRIGTRYPVYGLQSSRLTGVRPPRETVQAVAADYLERIRGVQPSGPYHLLGWSFGGLVAHAAATRLRAEGEHVALLALLDAYPDQPLDARPGSWPAILPDLLGGTRAARRVLARHPRRPAPAELARLVARYNPPLAALSTEQIAALTDTLGAHTAMMAAFAPERFDGDVLFFSADRNRRGRPAPADAWRPYVEGAVLDHPVDCAHLELASPEALDRIAPVLTRHLDAVGKEGG